MMIVPKPSQIALTNGQSLKMCSVVSWIVPQRGQDVFDRIFHLARRCGVGRRLWYVSHMKEITQRM